jgi:hypothetical protein
VFVALTLMVFGRKPFDDFLSYQIPAIASGAAFSFNDKPQWIPTNYGVYALVAKVRLLGFGGMGHETGTVVASAYGAVLMVLVVVLLIRIAIRERNTGRSILESPLVWLSLLNLAALRSPYVGDGYAQVGTLWLVALVASQHRRTRVPLCPTIGSTIPCRDRADASGRSSNLSDACPVIRARPASCRTWASGLGVAFSR